MSETNNQLPRREFLKRTAQAAAVAGLAGVAGAVPKGKQVKLAGGLPTEIFGPTKLKLPTLGYGGAALPKKWGNPLSLEDRIKLVRYAYDSGIRYFDTSISYTYGESQSIIGKGLKAVRDDVFITTKVDFWNRARPDGRIDKVNKKAVAHQIDMNLKELQSDYMDAVLIHGTPGVEQMTVEQCMEVHGELVKARDKGKVRFIGFSAHSYFDKALALTKTGQFDLCMLAYGYLPRGTNQKFSKKSIAIREKCLAEAHKRKMGIVAMKVVGAGVMGAWAPHVVPAFDKKRAKLLPAAAIRYVLDDKRFNMLAIGMRLKHEIDANVKTMKGDTTFTKADKDLLEDFGPLALKSKAMNKMKVE